MEVKYKGFKLKLWHAAPGIFFSLFGAAIIGSTIWKGFQVEPPDSRAGSMVIPRESPLEKKK